jgi:hypothetical protein
VTPGAIPSGDCDFSSDDCTGGTCTIDQAKCGDPSTCLPLSENAGKDVLDFRMRRLTVLAPKQLAVDLLQHLVVDNNLDLAAPECGEKGSGSFSWLIRIDRTASTLVTGGAPPSSDPFGAGWCFARTAVSGTDVSPAEVPVRFDGDSVIVDQPVPVLNVPIFVQGSTDNVVILPLRKVHIVDLTLTANGDCIGGFNARALDSNCESADLVCAKWKTAAALGGFVTLEDADKVTLRDFEGKTLCAYLTSASGKTCDRDASGHITATGDYCGATDQPGGCGDAYWLAATFAASAAKINDGTGVARCTP